MLHDIGAWHVGERPRRALSICNSNRKFVNPSSRPLRRPSVTTSTRSGSIATRPSSSAWASS